MKYEKLFTPYTLKGCTFSNRIMRTAMVSGLASEEGFITDLAKRRYAREAKGGVGAMVVEGATVHPNKSPFLIQVSEDKYIPVLKS